MRDRALWRWMGWAMVVLAAVQLALVGFRQVSAAGGEKPWLAAGDTLASLPVVDPGGNPAALTFREATVLLVFDPECPHCENVGAAWAHWVRNGGGGFRVVALSTRPGPEALAFAERHGLHAEVGMLSLALMKGRTALVAGRTPWAFVLDREGVIVAEGHGARVARLAGAGSQVGEAEK